MFYADAVARGALRELPSFKLPPELRPPPTFKKPLPIRWGGKSGRSWDRKKDTGTARLMRGKNMKNSKWLAQTRFALPTGTNLSILRKWEKYLGELEREELLCGLPEIYSFGEWLPLNGVGAGSIGYVSYVRNRLALEVGIAIDNKAYSTMVTRLETKLEAVYGIDSAAKASPIFEKDLDALRNDAAQIFEVDFGAEAGAARILAGFGQRTVDYERGLDEVFSTPFARQGLDEFVYTNGDVNKKHQYHDSVIKLVDGEMEEGAKLIESKAGEPGFVGELLKKMNAVRSSKLKKLSRHSFRRTMAIFCRRRWELGEKSDMKELLTLAQRVSSECGWAAPKSAAALPLSSFMGYSADWASWKQNLALTGRGFDLFPNVFRVETKGRVVKKRASKARAHKPKPKAKCRVSKVGPAGAAKSKRAKAKKAAKTSKKARKK
jgi:hypothetical protein